MIKTADRPEDEMLKGCSDGGCIIKRPPKGAMHTNGGCQCIKSLQYAFKRTGSTDWLVEYRRFVTALQYLSARNEVLKELEMKRIDAATNTVYDPYAPPAATFRVRVIEGAIEHERAYCAKSEEAVHEFYVFAKLYPDKAVEVRIDELRDQFQP